MIDIRCFTDFEVLTSVTLQEGTEKIRDYGFAQRPCLREVQLPDSLEVFEADHTSV